MTYKPNDSPILISHKNHQKEIEVILICRFIRMRLQRYLSKNKNSKNTQKLPKKTQCGQKKKDRKIGK